ncbi:peptidase a4 family protein [Hirsutella rhossiliensis]|uniref:Peptidase a4 family domain-containing protein n=1 Tax=Hirsutella rhossiliensis TaxID=111463 RepID=A0A9P8MVT0_9HYPO|nr:peptidase a4 family domain-containing protein [Hirsutella rhossiliensis]KAH0962094.1 peptidase a4 family domain-containing protein [Hirsutella rhossiliensis]
MPSPRAFACMAMILVGVISGYVTSGAKRPMTSLATASLFRRDHSSLNWCGAVQYSNQVTFVKGTWTVPSVSIPNGNLSTDQYWFYQWVGIDGVSPCEVLLQGGTGTTITNGTVGAFAWYEFYPAGPVYPNMSIHVGDVVYVSVEATSSKTGTICIDNLSTGESQTFNPVSQNGSLCQKTAEWIAEDPGITVQPFPSFSAFNLTSCKATTGSGSVITLDGAELWEMNQKGRRLCHAQVNSNSDLTVFNG